jgi:S1-C subfamily serine protease
VDGAPEAAATATAAAIDSDAARDPDQRQLAKITRGMSAAAGGGILVTATPPGSVTGQLRLREGDVIVAVNGESVSSPEEFARIYREQGVPRQLTLVRDGREIHRH